MGKKHPALVVENLRKRFGLEEVLKGLSLNANEVIFMLHSSVVLSTITIHDILGVGR